VLPNRRRGATIARMLVLIDYLQKEPRTLRDMQKELYLVSDLRVCRRTISRDMDVLKSLGWCKDELLPHRPDNGDRTHIFTWTKR
jgi:hypothetical protein